MSLWCYCLVHLFSIPFTQRSHFSTLAFCHDENRKCTVRLYFQDSHKVLSVLLTKQDINKKDSSQHVTKKWGKLGASTIDKELPTNKECWDLKRVEKKIFPKDEHSDGYHYVQWVTYLCFYKYIHTCINNQTNWGL